MAIFGAYVLGGLMFAASIGQITGLGGFASAYDVAQAQQVLKDVRLDQIRNRIDATRERQCQAINEGNLVAMTSLFQTLQGLVNQHYGLAGYSYRIPECGELVPTLSAAVVRPPTPVPTVSQAK